MQTTKRETVYYLCVDHLNTPEKGRLPCHSFNLYKWPWVYPCTSWSPQRSNQQHLNLHSCDDCNCGWLYMQCHSSNHPTSLCYFNDIENDILLSPQLSLLSSGPTTTWTPTIFCKNLSWTKESSRPFPYHEPTNNDGFLLKPPKVSYPTTKDLISCFFCWEEMTLTKMWNHVRSHILQALLLKTHKCVAWGCVMIPGKYISKL